MNQAPIASADTAFGPDHPVWAERLALSKDAAESNPFFHPALLLPSLTHLDPSGQVHLLEARQEGQLIGLMPVIPLARHSRYPVRNTINWLHDQCFFGAPLLRRGKEIIAWSNLLAQLDASHWAGNFLHLDRLDMDGTAVAALRACCEQQKRPLRLIDLHERAFLQSDLNAETYWSTHVRSKKRKELRRLINRLSECGEVTHRHLTDPAEATAWAQDFLTLEASGWKGHEGTALANSAATSGWFHDIIRNTAEAGMLDMLRIDVNGAPIAMLVNFRHLRGAFSYKIAFDESYARYSPGILIEIDNLHLILGDGVVDRDMDWMDSCAAPDHPMIDSLWADRRRIGQFRIALNGPGVSGLTRRATYAAISLAENALHSIRKEKA